MLVVARRHWHPCPMCDAATVAERLPNSEVDLYRCSNPACTYYGARPLARLELQEVAPGSPGAHDFRMDCTATVYWHPCPDCGKRTVPVVDEYNQLRHWWCKACQWKGPEPPRALKE